MTKASDNDFPSILVTEQSSAPTTPAASHQRIYIRTSDHTLVTVNSSGTVTPVGGGTAGALVFLEGHTANNTLDHLDFTSFISSTYDTYKIEGSLLVMATDSVDLRVEIGTGGGPTYDTGNNYEWSLNAYTSGGAAANDSGATGVARVFKTLRNASGYGHGNFSLTATALQDTSNRKTIQGTLQYVGEASPVSKFGTWGMQWTTTATAVTALRFITSSGNIAAGTIRIYGVSKT